MCDKRCCIHNQDAAQFLYMSRLEDDEDDAGSRYHDKRFVDHAGSYLIAVAGAYEVDGTDDGEQGNETQVQNLMVGNLRIIKELAVVDEFTEVICQPLYVVGIEEITGCKPIGHDETYQGCKECLYAKREGKHHHHNPQDRHEIAYLHENHRCQTDAGKGVESPACRAFILIAIPDNEIKGDETHRHNTAF